MKTNILLAAFLIIVSAVAAGGQIAKPVVDDVRSSEKTIKGAPFTAEAVTESVQILYDGTKIVRRTTSKLYRDNEGRYRRDDNKKQLGVPGETVEIAKSIIILDPVSGSRYELDVEDRTYKKSNFKFAGPMNLFKNPGPLKMEIKDGEWKINQDKKAEVKIESNSSSSQSSSSQSSHNGNEAEARGKKAEIRGKEAEARAKELEKRYEETQEKADKLAEEQEKSNSAKRAETEKQIKQLKNEAKELEKQYKALEKQAEEDLDRFKPRSTTEQLDTQNIEGLQAEGTRTTTTIPAGSIGNDRDINVVYEKWYSPELQMTILSKHKDPRFGEQTYRLSNISRDNPPVTTFVPPQDYTNEDEKDGRAKVPRVSASPSAPKLPKKTAIAQPEKVKTIN